MLVIKRLHGKVIFYTSVLIDSVKVLYEAGLIEEKDAVRILEELKVKDYALINETKR